MNEFYYDDCDFFILSKLKLMGDLLFPLGFYKKDNYLFIDENYPFKKDNFNETKYNHYRHYYCLSVDLPQGIEQYKIEWFIAEDYDLNKNNIGRYFLKEKDYILPELKEFANKYPKVFYVDFLSLVDLKEMIMALDNITFKLTGFCPNF